MKRSCKRLDHREGEKERKETFLLPIRFSSKRALPFAMECSVQLAAAAVTTTVKSISQKRKIMVHYNYIHLTTTVNVFSPT